VKSRLTKRARRDLERITAWWLREVGTPPREMLEDLRSKLHMLERVPDAGIAYASSGGRTVYHALPPRAS